MGFCFEFCLGFVILVCCFACFALLGPFVVLIYCVMALTLLMLVMHFALFVCVEFVLLGIDVCGLSLLCCLFDFVVWFSLFSGC